MISGGCWGSGSYSGNFSTHIENGRAFSDSIPPKAALFPSAHNDQSVRPVDANEVVCELADMLGTGYDDKTIIECIAVVKKSETIKRRFWKWKIADKKARE